MSGDSSQGYLACRQRRHPLGDSLGCRELVAEWAGDRRRSQEPRMNHRCLSAGSYGTVRKFAGFQQGGYLRERDAYRKEMLQLADVERI